MMMLLLLVKLLLVMQLLVMQLLVMLLLVMLLLVMLLLLLLLLVTGQLYNRTIGRSDNRLILIDVNVMVVIMMTPMLSNE